MSTVARRVSLFAPLALMALALASGAPAEPEPEDEPPPLTYDQTPPRLALVEGEVSFWRPGAEDWAPARPNVALASGDRLYTRKDSNLEIQIGPRAFLRAGDETELGLENLELDFLQLRVGSGTASLDLRSLPAGHTIEVDTPNAAFTIEEAGYYRIDVGGETTTLICRRGGTASLTPSNGAAVAVGSSEEVVVAGEDAPRVESYAAPELDDWDRWNYERTDRLLDSLSARYVSTDVYGVSDLDQYGGWRTVAPYGPVWIPSVVPVGWAPFRFGRWMWDPVFRWTWVDDAPWGWAPCHHGRWIFVNGRWAWAPGPIVVRSFFAPALVAFFGAPHRPFGIWWGAPTVAWVPLGWGEPCFPWWGPRGWLGHPHWFGWGGPRIVNQVVIHSARPVPVENIHFENASAPGALVGVPRNEFGRKPVSEVRVANLTPDRLEPLRGALPMKAASVSFAGAPQKVQRPPRSVLEQRVVGTRATGAPPEAAASAATKKVEGTGLEQGSKRHEAKLGPVMKVPEPHLVPPPERSSARREALPRPPFGGDVGEERAAPRPPPRFEEVRKQGGRSPVESGSRGVEPRRRPAPGSALEIRPPTVSLPPMERLRALPRPEAPRVAPRDELPGKPANRVFRGREGRLERSRAAGAETESGAPLQPSTFQPSRMGPRGLRGR